MHQLILNVPQGDREKIFTVLDEFEGINTVTIPSGEYDVFIIVLPYQLVNNFLIAIGNVTEKT